MEIKVDLGKKCKRCGEKGACENGLCLSCVVKGVKKGEYDNILKPIRDAAKNKIAGIVEGAVKSTQEKPGKDA